MMLECINIRVSASSPASRVSGGVGVSTEGIFVVLTRMIPYGKLSGCIRKARVCIDLTIHATNVS